jgi:hypothetical protein
MSKSVEEINDIKRRKDSQKMRVLYRKKSWKHHWLMIKKSKSVIKLN